MKIQPLDPRVLLGLTVLVIVTMILVPVPEIQEAGWMLLVITVTFCIGLSFWWLTANSRAIKYQLSMIGRDGSMNDNSSRSEENG